MVIFSDAICPTLLRLQYVKYMIHDVKSLINDEIRISNHKCVLFQGKYIYLDPESNLKSL